MNNVEILFEIEILLAVVLLVVITNLVMAVMFVFYEKGRADFKKEMWSSGIGGMQDRLDDKEDER